jgi:hypothetical protein
VLASSDDSDTHGSRNPAVPAAAVRTSYGGEPGPQLRSPVRITGGS